MGILDHFRRGEPKQQKSANALAMVLLPELEASGGGAAFDYLQANWSDLPDIGDVEVSDSVVTASIPGGALGLVHIPMPVPPGDLEGPTALAWHWPDANVEVARHRSHVIVHAGSSTLTPVDLRLLHSKLAAAVAAISGGLGVYVGDAMLLRAAGDYIDEARDASSDAVPTMLWVGLNPVSDDGALSAYTTGLTNFGLRELEVHRSSRPAAEVLGTLADVATYQLRSGRGFGDGDTFGASEAERIPVRHTRSAFLPDTDVALLGL
jgi:hypothetical protein